MQKPEEAQGGSEEARGGSEEALGGSEEALGGSEEARKDPRRLLPGAICAVARVLSTSSFVSVCANLTS